MRCFSEAKPARPGFTLMELLVVIAILATLSAIGAGAYHRVSASQQLKRSEATLKKVHTGLTSQWSAAVDEVNNEFRNGKAGGTAKVAYMNARLVQEFPVTFAEVAAVVPTKYPTVAGATATPSLSTDQESAICLYLALSKTRRGASFNPDDVGPGSIKTVALSNGKTVSYFVDSWGKEIKLHRPDVPSDPLDGLFIQSAGPDSVFGTGDDINSYLLLREGQRGN